MLSFRVIPLLLFRRTGLWKGVGFRDHKHVGDAMNAVQIFTQRRAPEIILLDIAATEDGRPIGRDLVQRVSQESLMPFVAGGGIGQAAEALAVLDAGAEKVAVNTRAVEDPAIISEIAAASGSQSIVAGIDVRRQGDGYEVFTHCGTRPTGQDPVAVARTLADAGAGEILLTSIDRDGGGQGLDSRLIALIADAVAVPVIACGGLGELSDLRAARAAGASAVAVGSRFVFFGKRRAVLVNYPTEEEIDAALAD